MPTDDFQRRRQQYAALSSQLAQFDDAQLRLLFDTGEASSGWGQNHTIELNRSRVFVKRLPVTDRENSNRFATGNLFALPAYYNYGVGSAGFGVFRELSACIKTTDWVLSGEIETFPLLYHYRIVPFAGERVEVDLERHQRYVEYWGGDQNIATYMLERANATHELLLFLEHMPYTLQPWLEQHPEQLPRMLDELLATIGFLRNKGVIHFDAHFHNIVSEGTHAYLTDWGLVLDRDFAQTQAELRFFETHIDYDYAEILGSAGWLLNRTYRTLPEPVKQRLQETYGVPAGGQETGVLGTLLDNIEAIRASGFSTLNINMLEYIARYRSVITLIVRFFSDMHQNNRKDTPYPRAQLRRLLLACGFALE